VESRRARRRAVSYFETRADKITPLIREVREKSEVRDDRPPPPSPLEAFDTFRPLDTI
jgi:hypothetical protein